MSLFFKFFTIMILISSVTFASDSNEAKVIKFLQRGIGNNPKIISLDIKIVTTMKLDRPKGWEAYVVNLNAITKANGVEKPVFQRSIYFVGNGMVTSELFDLDSGDKLNTSLAPDFNEKYYDKKHLLFGNKNAKHKIVLFSDPLCPFCRKYVPELMMYMKKYPKTFRVYYYHAPLENVHPASIPVVKAAIIAQSQGHEEALLGIYKLDINVMEPNINKILNVFNAKFNTKISPSDMKNEEASDILKYDLLVAQQHMVVSTPVIYIDGKRDKSKIAYKSLTLVK
ncbi:thioredoxin domain-containing protein [Sulfurimonas sp. MAG313]|nr:thioredoxin domain-containing protein [Sulfurimonas sp. MAG313]MDF1880263.1 thioredoxin domain-containing protein [Sulfurimonas sp. MAG313]